MAQRGKPLPFALKQEIRQRRAEKTVRTLASELRVSKTTVQKYSGGSLVQKPSRGTTQM